MTATAGAIRATEILLGDRPDKLFEASEGSPTEMKVMAEIIDRETGAAELLKALEDIAKGMVPVNERPPRDGPAAFWGEMWGWSQKRAHAAIAKHKGDIG